MQKRTFFIGGVKNCWQGGGEDVWTQTTNGKETYSMRS